MTTSSQMSEGLEGGVVVSRVEGWKCDVDGGMWHDAHLVDLLVISMRTGPTDASTYTISKNGHVIARVQPDSGIERES